MVRRLFQVVRAFRRAPPAGRRLMEETRALGRVSRRFATLKLVHAERARFKSAVPDPCRVRLVRVQFTPSAYRVEGGV